MDTAATSRPGFMNEHDFRRLIDRYLGGQCNAEEKRLVEDWLDFLEQQPGRFEQWNAGDQQKPGIEMLAFIQNRMGAGKRSSSRRLVTDAMWRVAASILLLIGMVYWINQSFLRRDPSTLAYRQRTPTKGINKHILPDGTLVWLKGKSRLTFPATFTGKLREVELSGEALFEVAKDVSHPFVIRCGSLRTRVVGTSFNIRSAPDNRQIEVVVLTGKVSLSLGSGWQETVLLPHHKAIYRADRQSITTTFEAGLETYLAGTQYDMRFEDMPLRQVVERVEQKFGIRIELEAGDGKNCLVSADLTDQSLAITLSLISQALGGDYRIQGGNIRLRIPDCS